MKYRITIQEIDEGSRPTYNENMPFNGGIEPYKIETEIYRQTIGSSRKEIRELINYINSNQNLSY
jgi:hypothetical protein